jgi:glutathione S-transferase
MDPRKPMLKILGKASSINVRKVLWLCAELELPYQLEEWGSGFRSTRETAFLALNPNALVPVIIDADVVLWESNTICRYLAARHPRSDLLPTAPQDRARVEQWMDWQATELNNAWRYAFMALIRKSPAHTDQAAIDASVESWNRHIGIIEQQLASTGAYMTGETFTLADIVIGLSLNRWFMTPLAHPHFPAVDAYWARLGERSGFQLHGGNGTP